MNITGYIGFDAIRWDCYCCKAGCITGLDSGPHGRH